MILNDTNKYKVLSSMLYTLIIEQIFIGVKLDNLRKKINNAAKDIHIKKNTSSTDENFNDSDFLINLNDLIISNKSTLSKWKKGTRPNNNVLFLAILKCTKDECKSNTKLLILQNGLSNILHCENLSHFLKENKIENSLINLDSEDSSIEILSLLEKLMYLSQYENNNTFNTNEKITKEKSYIKEFFINKKFFSVIIIAIVLLLSILTIYILSTNPHLKVNTNETSYNHFKGELKKYIETIDVLLIENDNDKFIIELNYIPYSTAKLNIGAKNIINGSITNLTTLTGIISHINKQTLLFNNLPKGNYKIVFYYNTQQKEYSNIKGFFYIN